MRQPKQTYQFSGHSDRYRRFDCFAEHVGDTANGRAVFVWRDGLFTIKDHSGASVFYVATRVQLTDIASFRDTKAANEALAGVR